MLLYRAGLDFADAMDAATAFGHASALGTFDRRFVKRAKKAGSRLPVEGV